MNKRENAILELLSKHGRLEVASLAQMLAVSQVTMRKDLDMLERRGVIRREHGYAVFGGADDVNNRLAIHYEEKRKIAREAAKQCRRALPMEITEPMPWQKAVLDMRKRRLLVAPWEEATAGHLTDLAPCADIGLLIGPEGGISAREIEECGAKTVTLGARILRTETAALAATAIIMAIMGEI